MRNIKLTIAYDGTNFCGYQRQSKNVRTVQLELEKALALLHKREIKVSAAGRTDSGVHASAQVVNFFSDLSGIKCDRYANALNGLLPRDVRVLSCEETFENFHARFNAKSRTYKYYIICGRTVLPTENLYALQLWYHPDVQVLNEYALLLQGEFDCTFFASPSDPAFSRGSASHYRYIYSSEFFYEDGKLVYKIKANAFLWKMVRTIVGTFLMFEKKNYTVEQVQQLIKEGDRRKAGSAVSPKGLFLSNVEY